MKVTGWIYMWRGKGYGPFATKQLAAIHRDRNMGEHPLLDMHLPVILHGTVTIRNDKEYRFPDGKPISELPPDLPSSPFSS